MTDLVGVVEACYQSGGSEAEWLAGVASAARPFLDGGFGVIAAAYVLLAEAAPSFRTVVTDGMRPEVVCALRDATRASAPDSLRTLLLRPVGSVFGRAGADAGATCDARLHVEAQGIDDAFCVAATDPDGSGVVLAAPLATQRELTPALARTWSRIAAHMAAGQRLRRIVPRDDDEPPAIFSAHGHVEHFGEPIRGRAERDALREAAAAIDSARGPRRVVDPHQAIEAWQALVDGRYTLVDHFDRAGRHYLVARANAPAAPGPSTLTARERQVVAFRVAGHPLKLIGYELGLSVATVSRTLTSAMRKLGVRTHVELARALGSTGS